MGQREAIVASITIPRSGSVVFQALTDSDEVAKWLAEDAYIEMLEGGRYEILGRLSWKRGIINRIDGERGLDITWPVERSEDDAFNTSIQFKLEGRGDQTTVTIRHSGIPSDSSWDAAYAELAEAWPPTLQNLSRYLQGQLKGRARTLLL